MKKIYLLMLTCASYLAVAQQDLQFTQYMFNRIYYNPGVAGSGDAICINALHRSQWVGFDGAPTSQNLNANIPISLLRGGLSLKVANDQIGFFQNLNAALGYAYQHQLGNGTLGAGVSFELFTKSVDNADWRPPDGLGTLTPGPGGDGAIPQPNSNGTAFDMNFGIYYQSERIWGGISANRLLGSGTDLDAYDNGITQFYNNRHFYVMGGYNWPIPGSNFELRPSFLAKTDLGASPQLDVNVMGVYNNKFWGGVTYRLQEAIGVNVGYQFTESLMAGYSYDIATAEVSRAGGGSHEIFVRYCFRVEIPPRERGSNKNPRFL